MKLFWWILIYVVIAVVIYYLIYLFFIKPETDKTGIKPSIIPFSLKPKIFTVFPLKLGSKGNKVIKLQRHLNQTCPAIYNIQLVEDGIFGNNTLNALTSCKRINQVSKQYYNSISISEPDVKTGIFRTKEGVIYPSAEYWIENNKYWKIYFIPSLQTTQVVEVRKSQYDMQYPFRIA